MYLKYGRTWYDSDGQHRERGPFLILLSRHGMTKQVRAIVRSVALSQCGHWMMGIARVYGQSVTVSGSYGHDGLTVDLERRGPSEWVDRVWESAVKLPDDLYNAWNTGGGWNSAGSEAPAMRQWAVDTFLQEAAA